MTFGASYQRWRATDVSTRRSGDPELGWVSAGLVIKPSRLEGNAQRSLIARSDRIPPQQRVGLARVRHLRDHRGFADAGLEWARRAGPQAVLDVSNLAL